jgi:hypothetical protein
VQVYFDDDEDGLSSPVDCSGDEVDMTEFILETDNCTIEN